MKSKAYNGLDLLKFIMALFVVMIHVKPNAHSEILTAMLNPIMSVAVPIFFVLSSVLLFNKLMKVNGGGYAPLLRYSKRLAILYFCWLIVDAWFVLFKRPYVSDGFPDGCFEFVKDLFLGTTFPGSWFLSALLVSVVLVFLGMRTIGKWAVLIFTLLLSLYTYYVDMLPAQIRVAYDWYAANVREEVNLSFPSQMIWVAIGMWLGCNLEQLIKHRKKFLPWAIGASVICYMTALCCSNPVLNYVWVVAICLTAFFIDIPDKPIFKRIRNYSIVIFLFHFSIAGKMSMFCAIVGNTLLTNWFYYILVVMVSIAFAEIVLRLEKIPQLRFLKYLH